MKSRCTDCGKILSKIKYKRCHSCNNVHIWKNTDKRIRVSKKLKGIPLLEETKLKMKLNHSDVSGNNNPMFDVHRFGEKSPCWIDGRSYEEYPAEFNQKLRDSIRKRDNYICQNCSMTEEEHLSVYGRNLEIHHIDYDKKNCIDSNLITLCKQCNIRANKNRNYWLEFYKEKMKGLYYEIKKVF